MAYRHYQRALAQWPVDLLRPEVSFQKAMQQRINRRVLPSTKRREDNVVANGVQAIVPTPVDSKNKDELEQVNVLYALLDNRYTEKVSTVAESSPGTAH